MGDGERWRAHYGETRPYPHLDPPRYIPSSREDPRLCPFCRAAFAEIAAARRHSSLVPSRLHVCVWWQRASRWHGRGSGWTIVARSSEPAKLSRGSKISHGVILCRSPEVFKFFSSSNVWLRLQLPCGLRGLKKVKCTCGHSGSIQYLAEPIKRLAKKQNSTNVFYANEKHPNLNNSWPQGLSLMKKQLRGVKSLRHLVDLSSRAKLLATGCIL